MVQPSHSRPRSLTLAALVVIGAAACASNNSAPSAAGGTTETTATVTVTQDDVRAMADHALAGFNQADYDAFSRDWDDAMKASIDRDAFLAFQRQTTAQAGTYQAITTIEQRPGKTAGTTNFYVHTQFTNQPMVFRLNYHNDSRLISGAELTSEPRP